MSDETLTLRCMVEEAAFKHGLAHTEENRRLLNEAWRDFLEAFRSDVRHELIAADSPDV